jgi:hypothetical protein
MYRKNILELGDGISYRKEDVRLQCYYNNFSDLSLITSSVIRVYFEEEGQMARICMRHRAFIVLNKHQFVTHNYKTTKLITLLVSAHSYRHLQAYMQEIILVQSYYGC